MVLVHGGRQVGTRKAHELCLGGGCARKGREQGGVCPKHEV